MPTFDRNQSVPTCHRVFTGTYPNYSSFTVSNYSTAQPANLFTKSTKMTGSNWSLRKNRPWIFVGPTNYSHSSHIQTPWQGYFLLVNAGSFQVMTGNIAGGVGSSLDLTTLPAHDGSLRSKALTKALLRLKDQTIDLSVSFLEREQTAKLLYDTARSIKGAYRDVRKGRMKKAVERFRNTKFRGAKAVIPPAKSREEAVKRFNEIQYGWKPALNDVLGATKALAARESDIWNSSRISVRGGAKAQKVNKAENSTGNCVKTVFQVLNQRAYCRLFYEPPTNEMLVAAQQVGLTNPFSSAYEVIPLSFILDFVLPIGNYLSCLDAALPYAFIGGWITEVTEMRTIGLCSSKSNVTVNGSARCYKHQSDRGALSMSPFPDFPTFKQAGLQQTSSAMAVFAAISAGKA